MPCHFTSTSTISVRHERFHALHPDGRQLIKQWLERSVSERRSPIGSSFEAFIYLWIAFNGYASCVTEEEQDSKMIQKLGNCQETRDCFNRAIESDKFFRNSVEEFHAAWPIFKVHKLRRKHLLGQSHSTRKAQVVAYLDACDRTDYRPDCFSYHRELGEPTPADWPHTLHAIYQVRCNLFHGEKSLTAENDRIVVNQALTVLSHFIELSGLLL